jgi:hypothetical protein
MQGWGGVRAERDRDYAEHVTVRADAAAPLPRDRWRRTQRQSPEKTQPNIFSADETADVGIDNQTPVAEGIGIGPKTRFTDRSTRPPWTWVP